MKTIFLFTGVILTFLISGCSKDVVSLDKYEAAILDNAFMNSIAQLQSGQGSDILKKNKIKTITFVVQRSDSPDLDSLTFVELDRNGKMIRRTTTDNVGEGCLPYMHRQEFIYDKDKIIKVLDYTFKFKSNSILDNWMLRDTSQLNLFDWEDYTYKGDTITVETGYAIFKFIKASDGTFIKQSVRIRTNDQTAYYSYEYSGAGIVSRMETSTYDTTLIQKYIVEENRVINRFSRDNDKYRTEYEYDPNGLIQKEDHYLNGKLDSRTLVTYTYY